MSGKKRNRNQRELDPVDRRPSDAGEFAPAGPGLRFEEEETIEALDILDDEPYEDWEEDGADDTEFGGRFD